MIYCDESRWTREPGSDYWLDTDHNITMHEDRLPKNASKPCLPPGEKGPSAFVYNFWRETSIIQLCSYYIQAVNATTLAGGAEPSIDAMDDGAISDQSIAGERSINIGKRLAQSDILKLSISTSLVRRPTTSFCTNSHTQGKAEMSWGPRMENGMRGAN